MGFGEIVYSKKTVQDTLERKLGAIECDSGNVEVQWNNIKECVLDTLKWPGWESREESKKTMDYTGNDQ